MDTLTLILIPLTALTIFVVIADARKKVNTNE